MGVRLGLEQREHKLEGPSSWNGGASPQHIHQAMLEYPSTLFPPRKINRRGLKTLKELTGKSFNVPITFVYQTSQDIYREVYASHSFPQMEMCLKPRCHDGGFLWIT